MASRQIITSKQIIASDKINKGRVLYIDFASVIRIFDINGRVIDTIVDKFFQSGGTITRSEDKASWNGRNYLGELVPPGTYLMHIEAINWTSGTTTSDMAPVVIGIRP